MALSKAGIRPPSRVLGFESEEIVGCPMLRLFPARRVAEEADLLSKIRAGVTVNSYESIRLHKDGHEIEMTVTVSPIKDRDGRIVGASTILRDITELRAA